MGSSLPVERLSHEELISHYGEVMSELLSREIVRSANNPIADIAERLVADFYRVDLPAPNAKAYDLTTESGKRVQVKSLRETQAARRNLSAIRDDSFDEIVVVVFECDMRLREALVVPHTTSS